jgi:hypothetical protein
MNPMNWPSRFERFPWQLFILILRTKRPPTTTGKNLSYKNIEHAWA